MKSAFTLLTTILLIQFSYGQLKVIDAPNTYESEWPTTTLSFKATEFNFGTVTEGEKIQNVFEFTNTGDEPLILINAKGSCGCTVPRFPRQPIMPGETANLLVQFDSKNKGKLGGARQTKRITISANTNPTTTYLTIVGVVVLKDNKNEGQIKSENFDIDANDIFLYPNPADQELTISLDKYTEIGSTVEIYDSKGSLIDSQTTPTNNGHSYKINTTHYPSGLYTASIKIDGKNRIAKRFYVGHN